MSRIDFYHLQTTDLEHTLPILLDKAYALQKKILVKIGTAERVDYINTLLWTYDEESFLPHGAKSDGNAELQPIWLTSGDDNPNSAAMLFLIDGAVYDTAKLVEFERVFYIFDGNDADMLTKAREFWKQVKKAGLESFYWQQNDQGKWQQK
ncbi:MAG: DNA polymerase III subunit chi [Alphaproteobacteria bacterium]|nr:DNA polymerase III subunit chi [Alphaproteobacteria bacterium]